MIIAVDIGNTTVAAGLIDEGRIISVKKFMTDVSEIEVNYRENIAELVREQNTTCIDGAVISSVVPLMTDIIGSVIKTEYNIVPLIISADTAVGIRIATDEPEKVGSDRIADAVGAVHEYGAPLIVIDMGTATTISVIDRDRRFLGGVIIPGVKTALHSLIRDTALLPHVKIGTPQGSVIGKNTSDSIQNGIIYGNAFCIDGICSSISKELGYSPKIIATGGNAGKIIPYCKSETILDKEILLKGLYIIFRNYKEKENAKR
ncbi:MAG: type III pantothenate kinase [Porcipelethomonas sp.]